MDLPSVHISYVIQHVFRHCCRNPSSSHLKPFLYTPPSGPQKFFGRMGSSRLQPCSDSLGNVPDNLLPCRVTTLRFDSALMVGMVPLKRLSCIVSKVKRGCVNRPIATEPENNPPRPKLKAVTFSRALQMALATRAIASVTCVSEPFYDPLPLVSLTAEPIQFVVLHRL